MFFSRNKQRPTLNENKSNLLELIKSSAPVSQNEVNKKSELLNILYKLFSGHFLLNIKVEGLSESHTSAILMLKEDKDYLVIDELWPAPLMREELVGSRLFVQTQHAGAQIEFETEILDINQDNEGTDYYKVAFPTTIEYDQRRTNFRFPVSIRKPIKARLVTANNSMITTELRDVSMTGISARIFSKPVQAVLLEDEVIPTCMIESLNGYKIMSSLELRHVEMNPNSGMLRIGAQFGQMSNSDKRQLERLVNTLDQYQIQHLKRA